ncbi:uncharacterized protein At2g29880-like [Rhododendron vialii]|uniref:uncharacterized protein At2g29880-like n=1 Tax=Rhododendron vialii TaxID=182163 RepID=UPI00265D9001|nr:uncharacterized protein At2g29880-like [Rhododendron vialii]
MDTQQGNVPNKKASRSHRVWRKSEEDALMKCMVAEISDKWSADNGFKLGFFTLLEKEMAKIMPESNIKASPHINSKVKYWRRTYAKICDIVGLSGFGWDHVNKRIDVDDDVWKIYEEANPKKVKEVGGKRFPYFDDWEIIFGKDRANGCGAEAPA